ncbi:MAG: amino acid ABC transporter permease [Ruminococcaceae bacterium]|nr:amino acid ABC transporter permease [Oscillospiraceae bacterium]
MVQFFESIAHQFNRTFIVDNRYKYFLEGLKHTIIIALAATLMGIIIGIVIAVIKVLHKKTGKLKILNTIFETYTTIIRGTPVVLQLLISYNLIFLNSSNAVLIGIIAFGINSGAYVSEIIRAGIMAVDGGQTEAGRSLGLSQIQTMRLIVLPQAFKNVLPALGNEFIALLKETSVIGYLGVMDLTKAAESVISRTANVYFPYLSIAIIYLIMVHGLSILFNKLERRFAQSDRG